MDKLKNKIYIPPEWEKLLLDEFKKSYFTDLQRRVGEEYSNSVVFPPQSQIFRAFELCPPGDVRVVILGQDPYHTPGVADGLAFSTHTGNPVPPSLKNIFKEIALEYNTTPRESPDLSNWAMQGVLLLNTSLTVESGNANSHAQMGWHEFTDSLIRGLSREGKHIVFMLWGNDARKKQILIDATKHLILESVHPSPLSAHKGFLGNNHFKDANTYLIKHQRGSIDWN